MKLYKGILLFYILFYVTSVANSRHIIGGDFYYETVRPGVYDFTLIVYRDCASGGALFDSQSTPFGQATIGTVSVYRSDSDDPYDRVVLPEPEIETVDIDPDNPCLIAPASLCVEKGEYSFRLQLPIVNQTYTISYQRCCRNNTINNIIDPGSSGATYTIDINPLAQQLENASLQFSNFPPVVICIDEPLNFDHSAFDPNDRPGVQTEYEFCSPFLGGGLAGSSGNPGLATDPNGVAPDPDLPPPYDEVEFVGGQFTPENPMGGSPTIQINRETGMITGTPNNLGQYVVGVCATEFDSTGRVISRIRRDFQFNVVECDVAVTASMVADSINEIGDFVISSCGRSQVQFFDSSYFARFVESHEWTFEVENSADIIATEANPLVEFPDLGTYPGQLIVNKGQVCSDTTEFLVNIYGEITNDFTYEYDTCTSGPVSFFGTSTTENDSIIARNWDVFGEEDSVGSTVEYEFLTPGEKRVVYSVIDNKGCISESERVIPYYPIPNEIRIEPEFVNICEPVRVQFKNLSYPLDETYDIHWDFGDGDSSDQISPTHIYNEPGLYTVRLRMESPIGCKYDGELDSKIEVQQSPIADFTYTPRDFDQFNRLANFRDLSEFAAEWSWNFGGYGQSIMKNPSFEFPDTGRVEVQLQITHPNGCKDTTSQILDIVPRPRYFLPNAFRPSGNNNVYKGAGDLIGVTQFEMQIFDRWGGLVFSTQNPREGWDGTRDDSGNLAPSGVYVCIVRFVGPRGKKFVLREFATLVE